MTPSPHTPNSPDAPQSPGAPDGSTAPSNPTEHSPAHDPAQLTGQRNPIHPNTPRQVRLEWYPNRTYEDRPSVFATNRELHDHTAHASRTPNGTIRLETAHYLLEYDGAPFSANGLSLSVKGGVSNYHSVWRYGQDLSLPAHRRARATGAPHRPLDGNLGGATRTLDEADGPVDLDPGVNSVVGYAVIDDSGSMVLTANGHLQARRTEADALDLYVFAAGHDHIAAVQDLFALSGPQPLLPRFALGTWWSRYHRYSAEEYLALMDRFASEGVPLSVAVLDMDWHLTEVDPQFGSGWTGYTWNRELFPDPAGFQRELHNRGLAVTLNVHPADGVRAFEEAYPAVMEAMGRPADGTPAAFDVTDPDFMQAYLQVLHRGLEEQGTDFWWIDWQSGPYSAQPGRDPLWVLNHEHSEDMRRRGERPLILSRYAGPGSHRYPVGFSGDTHITWDSLAFQPRMTAAAANIGYGWWSHDIGGHMGGVWDPELATRWVQFGVFSPILRLHSSNSRFAGKEPWRFPEPARSVMVRFLRLRHRLLPYLHAMNRRAHKDARCLVEPTYFTDPHPTAYQYLDQYMFGSELLVAPIVAPADPVTGRGAVCVRLPAGRWVDVATGIAYRGDQVLQMHRGIDSIPVLLREGGFLPLVADGAPLDAREAQPPLELCVAGGASGTFTLEEEVEDGHWIATRFALDAEGGALRIDLPAGRGEQRDRWEVTLLGFGSEAAEQLTCSGARILQVVQEAGHTRVSLRADGPAADPTVAASIVLQGSGLASTGPGDVRGQIQELLEHSRIGYTLKDQLHDLLEREGVAALASLSALGTTPDLQFPQKGEHLRPSSVLIAALTELLLAGH